MILRAFADGVKRTVSAPAVLTGVCVMTLAMALPLAASLREQIDRHLGSSVAADEAAAGVNYDWWQEFEAQASGLATTFTPSIIGFAAVLDNVSGILDGRRPVDAVAWALAAYVLVWIFLSGGIIDRFARQRRTHASGFFMASGVFFFRFVRLALFAGAVYWVLFSYVHHWLFDHLLVALTRNLDAEPRVFLWRAGLYLAFGLPLVAATMLFDYARIRAVVEDRRSMTVALFASARFALRNVRLVVGLYALNALVFVLLLVIWRLAAPSAGGTGPSMWLGFLLAQVYIVARLFLKLHFIASQTALFQGKLAHARYTAAPPRAWPESPSAALIHAGE